MKRFFTALPGLFLAACITAQPVKSAPEIKWLDFVGDVNDCSNNEIYCLSGDVLNFSVLKSCADLVSGRWEGTPILDRGDSAEYQMHSGLMRVQTIYVLGEAAYPYTVYLYAGTGILGIYTDPERKVDLVSIAKNEGLAGLVNAGGVRDRYFHPAIANVIWGRCQDTPSPAG